MTPLIRLHCVALLGIVAVAFSVAISHAATGTASWVDFWGVALCSLPVALVDQAWRMESVR